MTLSKMIKAVDDLPNFYDYLQEHYPQLDMPDFAGIDGIDVYEDVDGEIANVSYSYYAHCGCCTYDYASVQMPASELNALYAQYEANKKADP